MLPAQQARTGASIRMLLSGAAVRPLALPPSPANGDGLRPTEENEESERSRQLGRDNDPGASVTIGCECPFRCDREAPRSPIGAYCAIAASSVSSAFSATGVSRLASSSAHSPAAFRSLARAW
jgi:hypothetical protein